MEIKRAGDLMIPLDEYPHIPFWYSLRKAMDELEKYEFDIEGRRSLPRVLMVFNEKYQLMGIVRRRDIFRGLDPDALSQLLVKARKEASGSKDEHARSDSTFKKLGKRMEERSEQPVTDVMQRIQVTVNFDDHFIKVISQMVNSDLSLLPVVKEGEVAGVIRTVDLFSELMKLMPPKETRPEEELNA